MSAPLETHLDDQIAPSASEELRPSKADILEISLQELEAAFRQWGEAPYRARQVMRWIYRGRRFSFAEMTDLPKSLRLRLAETYDVGLPQLAAKRVSSDGTSKLLLQLRDGETIESVIIPADGRLTLCVSSQVGCAMRCAFCATAQMGLRRNLTAGEILGQILAACRTLATAETFTNYVFMGMGEPLANYPRLRQALQVMTAPWGMAISPRRITVSTVGLVPLIERLLRETGVNLAVSLTATTDAQRDWLMPVNRRFPIQTLLEACRNLPLKGRSRITFEYVLLKGVNDSIADAKRLARLLAPLRCKVNLIYFNPFEGSAFESTPREQAQRFQATLRQAGITATIRESRGTDIAAACGQLRTLVDHQKVTLNSTPEEDGSTLKSPSA